MKFSPLCLALFAATGIPSVKAAYVCDTRDSFPLNPGSAVSEPAIICASPSEDCVLDDSIVVPEGATCSITGLTINGNIVVKEGASLDIFSYEPSGGGFFSVGCVKVLGSIKADTCVDLKVLGPPPNSGEGNCFEKVLVDGDIEAKKCTGEVVLTQLDVKGHIKAVENVLTGSLTIERNTLPVDKDILVVKNSAAMVDVSFNDGNRKTRFDENGFNGELMCTMGGY